MHSSFITLALLFVVLGVNNQVDATPVPHVANAYSGAGGTAQGGSVTGYQANAVDDATGISSLENLLCGVPLINLMSGESCLRTSKIASLPRIILGNAGDGGEGSSGSSSSGGGPSDAANSYSGVGGNTNGGSVTGLGGCMNLLSG